jgi:hypothetical protein
MRNEPYDISDFGPLPLNEQLWATVCAGEARRVYVFGGPLLTGRCLPNALGLEPVNMHAYRYDAEGALTQPDGYLRIATQLAGGEGWLAFAWTPECAALFLRKADAIIWLDDDRARLARSAARHRNSNEELFWTVDRAVPRGVLAWPRRRVRGGGGPAHLLDIALEGAPPDPYNAFAAMVVGKFPAKMLRVTHDGQLDKLNAVRPTR